MDFLDTKKKSRGNYLELLLNRLNWCSAVYDVPARGRPAVVLHDIEEKRRQQDYGAEEE